MSEQQTVFKSKRRNRDFTCIDNSVILNEALSSDARMLLIVALSRPESWEFNAAWLMRMLGWGRDKLRATIKELEAAGHARRDRVRAVDGTLGPVVLTFFETPLTEKPSPQPENQALDKPAPEKPPHTKKEYGSTKTERESARGEISIDKSGHVQLKGGVREYWLEAFGSVRALDLALLEVAPYVQEPSRRPLQARVEASLAKVLRWTAERKPADARKRVAGSKEEVGGSPRDTEEPWGEYVKRMIAEGKYKPAGACDGR